MFTIRFMLFKYSEQCVIHDIILCLSHINVFWILNPSFQLALSEEQVSEQCVEQPTHEYYGYNRYGEHTAATEETAYHTSLLWRIDQRDYEHHQIQNWENQSEYE